MEKVISLILITALIGFLSGCSIQNRYTYKQELTTWLGEPESKLVNSAWGKPNRIYTEANDKKIYCYYRPDYQQYGNQNITPRYFPFGNPVVITPYVIDRLSPQNSWCETCFFMDKGKYIKNYIYRGPGCLSTPAQAYTDYSVLKDAGSHSR